MDRYNFYLKIKRISDFILALVLLLILSVPMLMIGIIVRLDSRGPAIYKQERLGKNGLPFMMYKYRSMRMDAEKDGPQWANLNDSRCTKVGRILRKSRIDELPQLFNIIKGDMSFVGPRPERKYFYDIFRTYIPNFDDRLQVTPGLTGYAQVNGGYSLKPEEKIVYDLAYIRAQSVRMDLWCIYKTIHVVLTSEGAR